MSPDLIYPLVDLCHTHWRLKDDGLVRFNSYIRIAGNYVHYIIPNGNEILSGIWSIGPSNLTIGRSRDQIKPTIERWIRDSKGDLPVYTQGDYYLGSEARQMLSLSYKRLDEDSFEWLSGFCIIVQAVQRAKGRTMPLGNTGWEIRSNFGTRLYWTEDNSESSLETILTVLAMRLSDGE